MAEMQKDFLPEVFFVKGLGSIQPGTPAKCHQQTRGRLF
jgi:hypothetical protein